MKHYLRKGCTFLLALAIFLVSIQVMPIKVYAKNLVSVGVKEIVQDCHTVAAIKGDNSLWLWGDNAYGDLGNGNYENSATPLHIMDNVKKVQFGGRTTYVLTYNKELYYFGAHTENTPQLLLTGIKSFKYDSGDLYYIKENNKLYKYSSSQTYYICDDAVESYSNGSKGYVLKKDHSLYQYGSSYTKDSNSGMYVLSSKIEKILDNVDYVLNGCMALKKDGTLWSWGNKNEYGQLGNGTTESVDFPVKILDNVKKIFERDKIYMAIKEDASLWAWGDIAKFKFEYDAQNTLSPVCISQGVKSVVFPGTYSYDTDYCLLLKLDNSVWYYGQYAYAQGDRGVSIEEHYNERLFGDILDKFETFESKSIKEISSGWHSFTFLLEDNSVWTFGYNAYGQLGNGTYEYSSEPQMIFGAGEVPDCAKDDEETQRKSIAVFTTEKSMGIKTDNSMWMGFGLLDENSGLLDDKWKKMSAVVSDPTVIELSDYTETEYGYSLEVNGKKQGASNITITDTESGISTTVTVFVQDDYAKSYSYAIDNITLFYPNNEFEKNIETNIYNLNGLYVNKYQCVKSKDSYNVSFDVYNSKYYSGAVDIYDENGMWIGYEEIGKYSNISGFWDTGEQAYFLISDTLTGKMLTYEQASFSKNTHIDIEVPEGGYFTISNNLSESPGAFFINAFEILFEGTSTAFDLFKSGGTKESALTSFKKEAKKSFATRLIEARNEGLKDNVKSQAQKIMLDSMKSKIKTIMKDNIKSGLKDQLTSTDAMCSDIASLAEDMLAPQSFNIEWKPMFESATGIGESFFTKFAGPAGIALKGCFALNDSTSKILMAKQMAESTGKPYVTIFSSIDNGYINPHGVKVDTNGNIDAESVLQVFRVSDSDAIEILLDSNNPLEIHELYNICFVKDDTLVQPNGKVTVHIPIPQGMKGNTCKVYRQEKNGSWTILDAKVQGNYLVFETEHFSLYALIGESDNLVISSLPNKTSYKDGERLDTNGLVLDLNGQSITEGYICEPTVLSGNGKQFIKVMYGHAATKFEITVEKETPTPKPDNQPTETSKPNQPTVLPTDSPTASMPVDNGTKTTVGKMKYKITKVNDDGTGEVTLIGTTRKKSDKRFTSLKVGNTVKIKGKSFKITAIGNSSFRGYKELKSVAIGKNVKKIGTKAFYGCKKLKKIVFKTKQLQDKKVGKKAFKGTYTKANIKVPKSKLKSYKKILRAKGVGKRAKIHT